jgi:hypothetical protein
MATGEFPRCATKSDFFARADSGENGMVPDVQVSIDGPTKNGLLKNAQLVPFKEAAESVFSRTPGA